MYDPYKTDVFSLGIVFIRMLLRQEDWTLFSKEMNKDNLKLGVQKIKEECKSNAELFELIEAMVSVDPAKRPDMEFVDRKIKCFKQDGIFDMRDFKFFQSLEPQPLQIR